MKKLLIISNFHDWHVFEVQRSKIVNFIIVVWDILFAVTWLFAWKIWFCHQSEVECHGLRSFETSGHCSYSHSLCPPPVSVFPYWNMIVEKRLWSREHFHAFLPKHQFLCKEQFQKRLRHIVTCHYIWHQFCQKPNVKEQHMVGV